MSVCGWALAARVRGYEQLVRVMPWPPPQADLPHHLIMGLGGGGVSLGQAFALAQAMVQRMRRPSAGGDHRLFYPDGTHAGGAEEPETPKLREQAAVAYGFALLAGAAGSSFGSADAGGGGGGGASLTEALYGILEPGVR
eukprot:COSAG01_NODE_28192_length_667_cov_0.602113_2_plen_140_part_00